ncbi:MAG: methyltransferase domain-containing protein [Actinobacteria bacterium]|nr:methyltransferase domain-containing protein [Actinomycetota bacterium]MBU1942434.1 methyltransferase domain-containing protein [Actinomycetota bacterium]MBU2686306.1 methyltransferase domain-containing protein [Actinomycetota bacterium]
MRCPRCFGALELEVGALRGETVQAGCLLCGACGARYPVEMGVAFLAAIDRTWKPMIGEVLSRVEITERVISDGGFEKDREQAADQYHEAASSVMSDLFDDAVRDVRLDSSSMVLDLGAGLGETASAIADTGAEVVACDVEVSHLLAANFWAEDPVYVEGCSLPIRNPVVYGSYFTRVMADIHRIPFADATFDVAFCRSTIHHLDDVAQAIREMARVTRPGGRVLLVSEPVRSRLDPEIEYLRGIFDYEEGLNERTWPITTYTLAMRRYCRGVEVRYFQPSGRERTRRMLAALRVDPQKHFHDGETLGFGRSFKLLVSGASVNVSGTRKKRSPRKPRRLSEKEIVASPEELWIRGKEMEERLRAVYRSCLKARSLPVAVEPAEVGRDVLSKGWREPERSPVASFRYTHKTARCYMRDDSAKGMVTIRMLGYPPPAGEAGGSVLMNGIEAGRFLLKASDSNTSFPKPHAGDGILEIEIRNDSTFIPDEVLGNGDVRELGVGVVRIWQE